MDCSGRLVDLHVESLRRSSLDLDLGKRLRDSRSLTALEAAGVRTRAAAEIESPTVGESER